MGSVYEDDVRTVLMLPWLAHGHICPFLELAKRLADRGMLIHFCSTPVNLGSVRSKLPSKYFDSITFVELHLPSLPDLPPRLHTTKSLPPSLMPTLKAAFDMSAPRFEEILRSLRPDLLVYDFIQPWAPVAAATLNIPAVEFLCCGAAMCAFLKHMNHGGGVEFPYPEIYIHDHEIGKFTNLLMSSANNVKDMSRFEECLERSVGIVLIKSFREIEGKYIDYLSHMMNRRVVPVGSLVENTVLGNGQGSEPIEWLDRKEKGLTVFVSFGSEYFLSREEMMELAHGLELCKMNFIWVVRFPDGSENASRRCLPHGFIKRVRGRGLVVEGWAAQAEILQHPSTGGFVSHCGWSSVMESLRFGVPIIAMPMHLDQPINARLVEEIGVGIEAKRDRNGKIQGIEVAKTIRNVVVDEVGNSVRRKSREMKIFLSKNNDAEIDVVEKELRQLCASKNYDQKMLVAN
ncbi:hypothetical protein MLD38_040679 [Melastoma candidum]|nr:hypothetical protein MLD38_040679 [Melastoma candidum]